ncbi:PREDICTED: uncharacterized protein LOC103335237 [Prunus mume]|uniref:Uncharacterized protein LOC103335237 n=1 Tax=Prunus mume TaxID=102107 RepID=A0ABM0P9X8_PRUMU|nr:PREDICTED: uncharacterized protein LOC103335237 [Prunus mume]
MVPPVCLRGPPELQLYHPTTTIKICQGQSSSSNPCLEFFKATTYSDKPQQNPPVYQQQKDLTEYEAEAWKHDPLTTLKLIFCLRMVGRPDKEAFYKSLLWIHKNHPLTLALNLKLFAQLGWFKDLLEILYRVLQKSIDEAKEKEEEESQKEYWKKRTNYCQKPSKRNYWSDSEECESDEEEDDESNEEEDSDEEEDDESNEEEDEGEKEESKTVTDVTDVHIARAKSACCEIEKISSISKFCPSIDSSYDRETLICGNIARRMFPRHNFGEYKDVEEAHYAYRVRDRLRKQVLSPLRMALECLPDVQQNNQSSLFKKCKELIALEIYGKIIGCGDGGDRDESKLKFKCYMKLVNMLLPKKYIFNMCFGDGLKLPHHVVASLEKDQCGADEIAEVQWRRLVQQLWNKRKLRNCIAVCDVPESRRGSLKEMVCISMGLLASDLSEKPWQGSVFPFSDFPRLHKIKGDNLKSRCEFMRNIVCAEKVDFSKIYNGVLHIATTEKLSNAKMPKSIFVFTYREFDKASKNDWVLDYREAVKNYSKRGYAYVPRLVFWNLKGSIAEPEVIGSHVVKNHNAGMIITGFFNTLLSLFCNGESNPGTYAARVAQGHVDGIDLVSLQRFAPKVEDVMEWALSNEELTSLFIFD